MGRFYFTKLSGAGNDFILFERKLNPNLVLNPNLITKFCDRRTGIGADGILLISDSEGFAYQMEYYNADGSTGSLCGNGARCSLQYGFSTGKFKNEVVEFLSNGNRYSGQVLENELVKFNLKEPQKVKMNFKIKAANQLINASYVDTGSPHVVINIKDVLKEPKNLMSNNYSLKDFPVYTLGQEIRNSNDFAPEGANVNFVTISNDELHIRTYERGVEDETLACGTGSVAASILSFLKGELKPPIKVLVRSGDRLLVDFQVENQKIVNLSLTGPAKVTFKGEITI